MDKNTKTGKRPAFVYLVDVPYGVGNIFAYIIPYHLKKENACSVVRARRKAFS